MGMASGEDDGCFRILRNCMIVVVVEDGGDVIKGVDGIIVVTIRLFESFLTSVVSMWNARSDAAMFLPLLYKWCLLEENRLQFHQL